MKYFTAIAAVVGLFVSSASAGPLNVTYPADAGVYPAGTIDVQWSQSTRFPNVPLQDNGNVTVSLWLYRSKVPYFLQVVSNKLHVGAQHPAQSSFGAQLGVVPASDGHLLADIPADLGPVSRYYRIYVNTTVAGLEYSQTGW